MNAFLTGSYVYGKHGIGSDIDLVLLVSEEVKEDLIKIGGMPCRFGDLNLILTTEESKFLAWKEVTERLIDVGRAVSREEAIAAFQSAGVTGIDYGLEEDSECSRKQPQTDSSTMQTTSTESMDVLEDRVV